MRIRRGGFSLVELLVVVAIISLMMALLLPMVQKVREAANGIRCANNLRQLGIALHHYHLDYERFPPGIVSFSSDLADGDATGFTKLLPYLEEDNVYRRYDFDQPWYARVNYEPVGMPIRILYCPSNRTRGSLDLAPFAAQWGTPLPPFAAGTDYAFCKGANAALTRTPGRIPGQARGVFDVNSKVRIADIHDGTGQTIAMGDASAGSDYYRVRDLNNPSRAATDSTSDQPYAIEQAWAAGCTTNMAYPYYGSVFAVTAQYGMAPNPRDEPMSPMNRLVAPTVDGGDVAGDNSSGLDWVSGFRSMHPFGCHPLL